MRMLKQFVRRGVRILKWFLSRYKTAIQYGDLVTFVSILSLSDDLENMLILEIGCVESLIFILVVVAMKLFLRSRRSLILKPNDSGSNQFAVSGRGGSSASVKVKIEAQCKKLPTAFVRASVTTDLLTTSDPASSKHHKLHVKQHEDTCVSSDCWHWLRGTR